jgi:predicted  nucleic acid-binding Zn-ribbon protein
VLESTYGPTTPMNAALQKLIELEKVDREIARLSDEVAALPKRVASIEEQLAEHKAAVEKAKGALKTNEADRRKLEAEIQTFQQKIVKYREQSSGVKTNEEYKALMHEVEFAEKQIGGCEDKILELMVALEAQEKALKAAEASLKTEGAEVEKEKAEAHTRTAEDRKELEILTGKRGGLRVGVDDSTLAHYDRVLRQRKTAIAEAREEKCTSCFVRIRPQTWQEILANDQIVICSSCARIFFYDPAHEPPPPVAPVKKKAKATAPKSDAETAETAGPAPIA